MNKTLLTLLAIGTVFSFYWLIRHRMDLRIRWPGAAALAVMHTLVGVACVKEFAIVE